jgi:Bacterial PH domain
VTPTSTRRFRSPPAIGFVAIFYCTLIGLPLAFFASLIPRTSMLVTAILIALVALVAARAFGVSLTLSEEGLVVRNGLLRHRVPWSDITGFENAWEILEPRGLLTLSDTLYVHRRGKKRLMIEAFIWSREGGEMEKAIKAAAEKHGVPLGGDFAWT